MNRQIRIKGYETACYRNGKRSGGNTRTVPTDKGTYIGIGDASGHGLPAGLTALIQQAAFQSAACTSELTGRQLEPYEIYNIVNRVICELNTKRIGSGRFMTQNYLYEENGTFIYAGAHKTHCFIAQGKQNYRTEKYGKLYGIYGLDTL
jgi:sigma-B regulation protein RsbU (phosphoserine phosphatase)